MKPKTIIISIGVFSLWFCAPTFSQHQSIADVGLTRQIGRATSEAVEGRIRSAAREYSSFAPVPRVAFFDIALPSDSSDLVALSGNAIILITSISQDSAELPLKAVRVKAGGKTTDLMMMALIPSILSRDEVVVRSTFGKYRSDAFYLLPISLKKNGNELLADFTTHRNDFRIGVLDSDLPNEISQLEISRYSSFRLSLNSIYKFILREYPMKRRVSRD